MGLSENRIAFFMLFRVEYGIFVKLCKDIIS